jgi:Holliday junction resolvase RusA-like endonuclease
VIRFEVFGVPAPQGSHTAVYSKKAQRAFVIPAGDQKAHKAWRTAVKEAAEKWLEENPQPPLDEPLRIRIDFFLTLPAADKYRTRHAVSPDIDKLCRTTFDSLTDANLIVDDSRFYQVTLTKLYSRPNEVSGARITIEPCGEAESTDRERLKRDASEMRKSNRVAGAAI